MRQTEDPTAHLPVRRDSCFSDHLGRVKKGLERKRGKLLAKVSPLLHKVLEPEEEIVFVAPACSPYSFLELFTTGWILLYLKRCLLVVTDRRILHLPTKSDFSSRRSVAEIRFGDVAAHKVATAFGRKLHLEYRNGRKEDFTALTGSDPKKLSVVLGELLTGGGSTTPASGRRHLCPKCSHALEPDVYRCGRCFLEFKTREKARRISILVPGGGYFYTGHPILGLLDGIVEGLLLLFELMSLVMAAQGDPEGWGVGLVAAAILVIEKLVTIYHADHYVKEFLPAAKE